MFVCICMCFFGSICLKASYYIKCCCASCINTPFAHITHPSMFSCFTRPCRCVSFRTGTSWHANCCVTHNKLPIFSSSFVFPKTEAYCFHQHPGFRLWFYIRTLKIISPLVLKYVYAFNLRKKMTSCDTSDAVFSYSRTSGESNIFQVLLVGKSQGAGLIMNCVFIGSNVDNSKGPTMHSHQGTHH